MTIKVGVASGGGFVASFASSLIVKAAGSSGNLIVLTPPAGERVLLGSLSASAAEVDITVKVGVATVVDAISLAHGNAQAGKFKVRSGGVPLVEAGKLPAIIGGVDESIVISSTATTTSEIRYSYQTGTIK